MRTTDNGNGKRAIRLGARRIHEETGISLPVCKVLAGWLRDPLGPFYAAHRREGRVPRLVRRARRAVALVPEGAYDAGYSNRFRVEIQGPAGSLVVG